MRQSSVYFLSLFILHRVVRSLQSILGDSKAQGRGYTGYGSNPLQGTVTHTNAGQFRGRNSTCFPGGAFPFHHASHNTIILTLIQLVISSKFVSL